ncbi:MAG: PAS domain S-box protein [Candidatus Sulfotelmatobacter sp.]
MSDARPDLPSDTGADVSVESILCTEALKTRVSRPPDYETESRALVSLAQALADSPRTVLQTLADTLLDVCRAGSAGVSLLTREDGGKRFYWPAIAGQWKAHIGGGTPRNFGPCGDVLDRNTTLLFNHVERRYTYFQPVTPVVEEALLVPFYVEGKAVGTIWAVAHDPERKFDAEDERLMNSLGKFASSAFQILSSLDALQADAAGRQKGERANSLLAAIVDSSDDAIVSKSLDGVITSWNKSAEFMFGYTAEEAIGNHITLVIPAERHSEETDILNRLSKGERVDHFQTVRRRKDGAMIDVSLTISPVRDSSGRVIGASKVARDISKQRQAETALRESEQRFRVITDASPMLVWMAGTDKLCYYFNKVWLDFVGRTLEQESGNGWAENVHKDDFESCLRTYVSSFDARLPFEMEYRMRHHTGQYRWILDRGVPRYAADGSFEGYLGACLDIHGQKEAAEKLHIADDMTRLMRAQDEERRRIARELHDSAGQIIASLGMNVASMTRYAAANPSLSKIIDDTQDLVQELNREIRTTSYLLHPPLLDESGLPEAIRWYMAGLTQRSNIAVDLKVDNDFGRLPEDVELALFRIVQECMTNIHRHSGSKTAELRLFRAADKVQMEIRDEGKGIPSNKIGGINGQPFGVGIAGMRERVRHLEGEIDIESSDRGTKVRITLPLNDNTKEQVLS